MGILLAFAPFVAFAVISNLWSGAAGLIVGACCSAALIAKEALARRKPKILEIGTFLMLAGLAGWVSFSDAAISVLGVRLCVDIGLLCVILLTIALRQPFTLQYAKERVSESLWKSPRFIRTNYIITCVWGLAFACIVAADAVMVYVPDVPLWVSAAITVLVLLGAYKFSGWYPRRLGAAPGAISG